MNRSPTDALIINRRDIRRLMHPTDFLDAVELGFRAAAMGKASAPLPMHLPVTHGGFHAKGASMSLGRDYVAIKINGNFPANPAKHGLPTIQGAVLLADGTDGRLLAILDSTELTLRRTAAASALAAKLLAVPDAQTLLVCGCGEQGRAHIEALRQILPIEHCLLWDRDQRRAEQLAGELDGSAANDLHAAAKAADIIITCTPATEPFLDPAMVGPGTFIAAVGADNPDKSEIDPRLMAAATIVTDLTSQCAAMGDLHHAIRAGCMLETNVHAELGELLTGERAGRGSSDEVIIFDSTGTGLQDVATAAAIYERCLGDASIQSVALSAL